MLEAWREKYHRGNLATKIALGIFAGLGIIAIFCVFALAFGAIIQWLWNATLVQLFDFPELSYWQAIGLFILAKLFFGFGGGSQQQSKSKEKKLTGHPQSSPTTDNATETGDDIDNLPADSEFRSFWEQEGREAYRAYLAQRCTEET